MRLITFLSLISFVFFSQAASPYFAKQSIQSQTPLAFALQPESKDFIKQAKLKTINDAKQLIALINAQPKLMNAINNWHKLSFIEKTPVLQQVFALEWQSFSIEPPKLIIDDHSYPNKTVYFDFDPTTPSSGIVYLNSEKLAKMGNYAALAFVIHETRHSYQFQLSNNDNEGVLAKGYRAAFITQKQSKPGALAFADFLTLVNEYEAFQFGNYVVASLTNHKFEQIKMGTLASQFNKNDQLKVDLDDLFNQSNGSMTVLEQFNIEQKRQAQLLAPK